MRDGEPAARHEPMFVMGSWRHVDMVGTEITSFSGHSLDTYDTCNCAYVPLYTSRVNRRSAFMGEPSRFSDPGYTPARGELSAAIDALIEVSDDDAAKVERALARAGLPAAELAQQHLGQAESAARVRLLRLIARVARLSGEQRLVDELRARLSDSDASVQRASIIGLGKLKQPGIEETLLDYAARGRALPEYRVLIEALGKVGGQRAADWLKLQSSNDEFTARVIERARLMLTRTATRPAEAVSVRLDIALGSPQILLCTCREGLEPIVAEQVCSLGEVQTVAGGVCLANFAGSLSDALTARSALSVGIRLRLGTEASVVEAVLSTLKRAELFEWMTLASGGVPRVRLNSSGRATSAPLYGNFKHDSLGTNCR